MPLPEIMWNSYRNRYLAAYYQSNGIKVTPNVSWSREWSYDFYFEGFPQNSVIAINSTGIRSDKYLKYLWRSGYEKAVDVLKPVHILRYGAKQQGEYTSISTYYPNDNLKFSTYGR